MKKKLHRNREDPPQISKTYSTEGKCPRCQETKKLYLIKYDHKFQVLGCSSCLGILDGELEKYSIPTPDIEDTGTRTIPEGFII